MQRGIGLIVALFIATFSLCQYYGSSEDNPVTGETQRLGGVTMEQEVALGMEAAPQMAQQHGGLHPDAQAQATVDRVCANLLQRSDAGKVRYPYECHLLADEQTVNAFALPGGQVFVTAGLADKLKTEGQLAGVLAHEIAHVVARHGAEHVAKQQLTQGLTGAAVLATYDPQNPTSQGRAAMVMMAGQLLNMRYGRADELESDRLGVKFMSEAGYDPRSMIGVMEVLAGGRGGGGAPEFISTHPNPENRIGKIQEAIQQQFPQGVPAGLRP
jgi:predicted Zn-dependent protease